MSWGFTTLILYPLTTTVKNIHTDTKGYNYILVGAGSASCLITSRLSQLLPDHQFLVLEAGEHLRDDPKIQTPGLSSTLQSNPLNDWQYPARRSRA
jgi:choline dehydrogenase-like flavoprotein